MKKEQAITRKKFSGVVVSDSSEKTILVRVETVKTHPKYHKRYTVSRNYQVHDEKGEYQKGARFLLLNVAPIAKLNDGG